MRKPKKHVLTKFKAKDFYYDKFLPIMQLTLYSASAIQKQLMNLVLAKEIRHNGHPILHWMMYNVCVRTDPADNIKMDKSKSTEKIDGAVATVMALDRAIRNGTTSESVYNSRGLVFI